MGRKFIEFTVTAEELSTGLLQETGQPGSEVALAVTDTDQQLVQQTIAQEDEQFDGVVVGDETAAEQQRVMELESLNGGIQETFDAVTQFEDLLDIAERAEKGEGLTEDAAQLVQMTHEGMVNRSSLIKHLKLTKPVLSLENYRSQYSKKAATYATVATLEANFKQILIKIKEAIIRAWNIVQNGLTALVKNVHVTQAQIHTLSAQLNKLNSTDSSMRHSELLKVANGIRIGNKSDPQTAKMILISSLDLIHGAESMSDMLRSFNTNDRWFEQAASMVESVVTKLGSGAGQGTYGHLGNGLSVSFQRNSDDTISIGNVETGNPVEHAKAPTIDEMQSLLGDASMVVKSLKNYQRVLPDFKKASETIIKSVDDMISASQDSSDDKENQRKAIRSAIDMVTYFGSNVPSRVYFALKHVLAYISAGTNNYGRRETASA